MEDGTGQDEVGCEMVGPPLFEKPPPVLLLTLAV